MAAARKIGFGAVHRAWYTAAERGAVHQRLRTRGCGGDLSMEISALVSLLHTEQR
jgi:hypothetical protein